MEGEQRQESVLVINRAESCMTILSDAQIINLQDWTLFQKHCMEHLNKCCLFWDAIVGIVMAIAGCDTQRDKQIYKSIMLQKGFDENKLFVCNDTEAIFRALSDEDGVCVVAGTGSIVCAYDAFGLKARVGGWGSPLSDYGSGYWIGAQILKKVIRWYDGINEETRPVYKEIAEALCREIINKATEYIIEQIVVLCRKVNFTYPFSIVTVGGIFRNESFRQSVIEGVEKKLSDCQLKFLSPVNSPAEDGLQFAQKLYRTE